MFVLTVDPSSVAVRQARCYKPELLAVWDADRSEDTNGMPADKLVWDVVEVHAEGVMQARVAEHRQPEHTVRVKKRGMLELCRGPVPIDRPLTAEETNNLNWFILH